MDFVFYKLIKNPNLHQKNHSLSEVLKLKVVKLLLKKIKKLIIKMALNSQFKLSIDICQFQCNININLYAILNINYEKRPIR